MSGRSILTIGGFLATATFPTLAVAQDAPPAEPGFDLVELLEAGQAIGLVILALSVAMVALIVEHALSIRKSALVPDGLGGEVQKLVDQRQFADAERVARESETLLGDVLTSGLREANLGWPSVEKAMEDSIAAQSARLQRKIDYLQLIGTLAPMLGLLGTVWGMIQAFQNFETKVNPQVSELAPGIYGALVTTLLGLSVAVPALAAYAFFRNRIDEYVARAAEEAVHIFANYKRTTSSRRSAARGKTPSPTGSGEQRIPPIVAERSQRG